MVARRKLPPAYLRALLAGALVSLVAPIHAQPSQPQTDSAVAEEHRARGVAAYERGDHEAALRDFEQAYAVSRDPALLYAMAQSERALGRCARAVPLFERFVEAAANEQQEAAATANIERCQAELANQGVIAPSGTAPLDPAPPAPSTPPQSSSQTAVPQHSETQPTNAKSAPPEPTPPSSSPAKPAWHADALAGTLLATGVAIGGIGTVLFLQASGEEEDARELAREPTRGDYQSNIDEFKAINQKRKTARVLFVGGGLLVGLGVLRYVSTSGDSAALAVSSDGVAAAVSRKF